MGELSQLEPKQVWKHFENLCAVPRPSFHEEAAAIYVVKEAERLGLTSRQDETGNVVVQVPATSGMEDRPIVVLQGHLDMVPVAEDGKDHDFTKDPIEAYIDGDYVRARGTTLGADNGIGCALALGLVEDDSAEYGPLELLFTTNEESGMDGAHGLQGDFLKGRKLINLDGEQWGEFFISCAGGGDSLISLPIEREEIAGEHVQIAVNVGGLKGGHSGIDINLGRGNANKLLGRCLAAAGDSSAFSLISIQGGNERNAIADRAQAVIDLAADQQQAFESAVTQMAQTLKAELAGTDPGFAVEIKADPLVEKPLKPMTSASTRRILDLLISLHHGIFAMSCDMPDIVETSSNIGVLECSQTEFKAALMTRSLVDSQVTAVKRQIRTIGRLLKAKVEEPRGYPGWKPNVESPLLKAAMGVFQDLHGQVPAVKGIHAGLECGLFGEKFPGLDMISIGPTMQYVHSPDEELYHPSVPQVYELLKAILKAIR